MEIQWSLVLFTVLSGMGAWLAACIGIEEFRGKQRKVALPGSILAVVLLAIGGIISVSHLAHPLRVVAALSHPAPGIFLEALLLGILAVVIIIYAVLVAREISPAVRKVLGILMVLLAIAFTFACGSSYMMASRPAWNTILLPLAYLGTACASGTALALAMAAIRKEEEAAIKRAALLTVVGGIVAIITTVAYGAVSGSFESEGTLLILGCVVCGGIVPTVCGALALKRPNDAQMLGVIALICGVIGAISLRALMWIMGTPLDDYFGVEI